MIFRLSRAKPDGRITNGRRATLAPRSSFHHASGAAAVAPARTQNRLVTALESHPLRATIRTASLGCTPPSASLLKHKSLSRITVRQKHHPKIYNAFHDDLHVTQSRKQSLETFKRELYSLSMLVTGSLFSCQGDTIAIGVPECSIHQRP